MKKIILAGGGTLGPVTPLLAFAQAAREANKQWQFVWVGTSDGPEQTLVATEGLMFYRITAAKLDRFFSLRNCLLPFTLFFATLQSLRVIYLVKPDLVVSVGGFSAVPVGLAAWLWRVPIVLHQQDVQVGLANRLLRPLSRSMTSTFTRPDCMIVGNLVRQSFKHISPWTWPISFSMDRPLVVLTGGGTGAAKLNELLAAATSDLVMVANVLHITGRGKQLDVGVQSRYQQIEFATDEMPGILDAATVVVTRAGMATLTELAYLSKAAIVIPMPNTHQEHNAKVLGEAGAAVVLSQEELTPQHLTSVIRELLCNKDMREGLGHRLHMTIPDGTQSFINHIDELLK